MAHPNFIDNRHGNTLAKALREILSAGVTHDVADASADRPEEARIVTAFFSPAGFAQIADPLRGIPDVRLLLGVDLAGAAQITQRSLNESKVQFEHRRIQQQLDNMVETLRMERDRLPFTHSSHTALKKLVAALRADNMQVRRFEKEFLHAKAYIFTSRDRNTENGEAIIAGSSNLTGAGLTSNLELNISQYDKPIINRARDWFDDLWEEAEPYDLAIVFEEMFEPRTPWEIFLRVLWQLYGEEVEADAQQDDNLPLTSFQKHGVARALRLIRKTGGVIVADEVGLGKTFIAGEIIQFYREHRQRALLVCPASLRDTTWKKFLARFQLFVECLSYEELASDTQLRDPRQHSAPQEKLQRPRDEYQIVVVDEAHNYRNPNAPTRAAILRRLLFGQRRDLLLLTATPVNNSLWDLYHLMRFFVRQDAHFADRGIRSIRERFTLAMRADPSNLNPDLLYPIIDATTVKRTRQFVKKHYTSDTIIGTDGKPTPIVFPKPIAISVRYDLDDLLPDLFGQVEKALDPDSPDPIRFDRYTPDKYLFDKENEDQQEEEKRSNALVGLLRSCLLKRFESSVCAFRKTLLKMKVEHVRFIRALEKGHVLTTAFLQELSADDETIFEDMLANTEHCKNARDYNIVELREAVEHDLSILSSLLEQTLPIQPESDPKLKALSSELVKIARQAREDAIHDIDRTQKRKVLVFSYFTDTVEWIQEFLQLELSRHEELSAYHNRMAVVSGSDELGNVSRQRAVRGFAPVSMEAPVGEDNDQYDLLITTDVLAEGVNLQQCRHIINFDMPWNPMRLVQRHGRIDRIGSPHNRVFLRTIFPFDRLEPLLKLEKRILNKLAMAAASIGVVAPIEGASSGPQVFAETKKEIEKLLKEDASLYERGGTAGSAQTGEEYRQTLRKELSINRNGIVRLPWKIGSGMVKGAQRGFFFCAVVGERTYLRFVPATDDWGPSTTEDAILRETGTCLRLIECTPDTPTQCPNNLHERVYDFWEIAQKDIHDDWTRETDPAYLQPQLRSINRRAAEFLRRNSPVNMAADKIKHALDILESPWPRREEMLLREWFAENGSAEATRAICLIEKILDTGLEPAISPPPLPPIDLDNISLLCWMGIECDPKVTNEVTISKQNA